MTEASGCRVRELLPDDLEHMDEVIKDELVRESGGQAVSLPGVALQVAGSKAAEAVYAVMDCDVFELLARAWCTARELHEYKDDVRHPRGQQSTLFLGQHSVTVLVHPILSVNIGPIRCAPLRFNLELAADFRSAELSILDGHIVAVAAGDCSVSAQLKYGSVALHDKVKSRDVKLARPLELRAPGLSIS